MDNDLISRSELIKQMGWKLGLGDEENGANVDYMEALEDCKELIDNAPAVEYTFEEAFQKTVCEQRLYCPERPIGEWIEGSYGNIKCNKCGAELRYLYLTNLKPDFPKFCCDCGAKMQNGD